MKIFLKIVKNFLIGAFAVFAVNLLCYFISWSIPLNPISAALTGFLGIPGFILTILLKYII